MLSMGPHFETLHVGEEIDRPPYTVIVSRQIIVMAEHNSAASNQRPGLIDIGPSRMEVVASVNLNQVGVHTPLAKRRQCRTRGERHGKQSPLLAGVHDVLNELLHENYVTVDVNKMFEHSVVQFTESRPSTEVVETEYDCSEVTCEVSHVKSRGAQERSDLDDGLGLRRVDEFGEDGGSGAPTTDTASEESRCYVRWREILVGGDVVVDFVEEHGVDLGWGNWGSAVGSESNMIVFVGIEIRRFGLRSGEKTDGIAEDEDAEKAQQAQGFQHHDFLSG